MWAAWVTGPATDDRRPARVPLDQPLPGKRRVRACLKRGAWQIVYKQGMRGDCSASEEGMSQVSTANGRAPCAPARRPPLRSLLRFAFTDYLCVFSALSIQPDLAIATAALQHAT